MGATKPMSSSSWTSRCLDLAGFGTEIRTDAAALRAIVIEDTETLEVHGGPVSLRVSWSEVPLDLDGIEFSGENGHRQFGRSDCGLFVRHRGLAALSNDQGIEIGGTGSDATELLDDFQTVFGSALAYWLSLREYFPIHGAAVGRDDTALLILGAPGTGKSTAAWGAHRAGMGLLADDTVFVRQGAVGYEIRGMPKPIAIPREVLGDLPAGASQDPVDRGGRRDRWELPPGLLTPGWHRLVGVLTPVHGTGSDGALITRAGSALLRSIIGAYYSANDETQLRSWFPHAAAIARLPAWDLVHTPEVERRLETAACWIGAAFDELASASES